MTVVVSVQTADAAPDAAPYRVSQRPGHTDATVTIDVTGAGPVRAVRLLRDSPTVIQGVELASVGGICGISRCDTFRPTALATPARLAEPIAAGELGSEGDHTIGLYVYTEVFE